MTAAAQVAGPDKRAHVESVLTDVLKLMEYPATLDFKDMPDGGIGVAVHFSGELPGITPGKRSYLVDCLQFITNKIVNRPNTEKRWVTLGVNAFPEPRGSRPEGAPPAEAKDGAAKPAAPPPPPKSQAPQGQQAKPPAKEHGRDAKDKRPDQRQGSAPQASRGPDEASLAVAEDPELTARTLELLDKSARLGRPYAVLLLTAEDRARMLAQAKGKPGLSARAEGEAHWRRLAIIPDKLSPMPKRAVAMMHDDEEE